MSHGFEVQRKLTQNYINYDGQNVIKTQLILSEECRKNVEKNQNS